MAKGSKGAAGALKSKGVLMIATLTTSIVGGVLGFVGATAEAGFAVVEHRLESYLVNNICSDLATAAEMPICNSETPLRDRVENWAKGQLSEAWDAVKSKFGGGKGGMPVDDNAGTDGNAVALDEVDDSLSTGLPDPVVKDDYEDQGDDSPPSKSTSETQAEQAASETPAEVGEGEPGSTTGSEVAENPIDAEVAGGGISTSNAESDGADGVNVEGGAGSVSSTLTDALTKIGQKTFSAIFSKTSLVFAAAAAGLAYWSASLQTEARRAGGPSAWNPADVGALGGGVASAVGSTNPCTTAFSSCGDIQWLIQDCDSSEFLNAMVNEPETLISQGVFWGWNPSVQNDVVNVGGVNLSAPDNIEVNGAGTDYKQFSIGGFGTSATEVSGPTSNSQDGGGNYALELACSQLNNASVGTRTQEVQDYVSAVNNSFQLAENESFYSVMANPQNVNMAEDSYLLGVGAPGDIDLLNLYSFNGQDDAGVSLIDNLYGIQNALTQTVTDPGSIDANGNGSLVNICLAKYPGGSNINPCGVIPGSSTTDLNSVLNDIQSQQNTITCPPAGCTKQETGELDALNVIAGDISNDYPTGVDLLAYTLSTGTSQEGQNNSNNGLVEYNGYWIRTNGSAYQEMLDQLEGNGGCGIDCDVLNSEGKPIQGQYNKVPSDAAWDSYNTAAQEATHSFSGSAIDAALALAKKTCIAQNPSCSDLFPTPVKGNPATTQDITDGNSSTPPTEFVAMMLAVDDVLGNYALSPDGSGGISQGGVISPDGNQGIAGLLPTQFAQGISEVSSTVTLGEGGAGVDGGFSDQNTAAAMLLAKYLQNSQGSVLGAFEQYVLQNHLPPVDGRWGSDPPSAVQDGWGGLVTGSGGQEGHMSTAALLTDVYDQYMGYFTADNPEGGSTSNEYPTVGGQGMPDSADIASVDAAAAAYKIDPGILFAIGNKESDWQDNPNSAFNSSLIDCSTETEEIPNTAQMATGKANTAKPIWWEYYATGGGASPPADLTGVSLPTRYGVMGLTADQFVQGVQELQADGYQNEVSDNVFTALPTDGTCPDFGEPEGMLDTNTEIWATAAYLNSLRFDWMPSANTSLWNSYQSFTDVQTDLNGGENVVDSEPLGYVNSNIAAYYAMTGNAPVPYIDRKGDGSTYNSSNGDTSMGMVYALTAFYLSDDFTSVGDLFEWSYLGSEGLGGPLTEGLGGPLTEGPGWQTNGSNPTAGNILGTAMKDFPEGDTFIAAMQGWQSSGGGGVWAAVGGFAALIILPIAITVICPPCGIFAGLAGELAGYGLMAYGTVQMVGTALQLANTDYSNNPNAVETIDAQGVMTNIGQAESLLSLSAPMYDLWKKGGYSNTFVPPGMGAGSYSYSTYKISGLPSTATGTFTFNVEGGPILCTANNVSGTASCQGALLEPGVYDIQVSYYSGGTSTTPVPNGTPSPGATTTPTATVTPTATATFSITIPSVGAETAKTTISNFGTVFDQTTVTLTDVISETTSPTTGYGSTGSVFWKDTLTYPETAPTLWTGIGSSNGGGAPWGQCTWFVNSEFYTGLGGNGGDIYSAAVREGLTTGSPKADPGVLPPVGAVVSWDGPGYNAEDGHTAVVVYDDPNGKYYVVGEANYWEEVQYQGTGTSRTEIVGIDMRKVSYPDSELQGWVIPNSTETSPTIGNLQQFITNGGSISS